MLAKLSALALFATLASALHLSVPLTVDVGASVTVDVAFSNSDPAQIDLVLIGTDVYADLADAVNVAACIDVQIPATHIHPAPGYVIAAIEVGHPAIVYAKSNTFEIEASA